MNIISASEKENQEWQSRVQLFKLLSHPARLAILETLRTGEECVCHMEAILGYRQAYLSQQIALLREAGIVQDRRDGWNIYYQVVQPQVFEVLDAAAAMTGISADVQQRTSSSQCPCPKCSSGMD